MCRRVKKRASYDSDNCDCPMSESIESLDTSLSIRNSSVDLYRKPSDRCAYLLPSSCHPPHTTKNIPFSLALRIVRICMDTDSQDLRLGELQEMLRSHDYGGGLIDTVIQRPVTYDPRLRRSI